MEVSIVVAERQGLGKKVFVICFSFFPWISLSLQIQYGLIYLSELVSLVFYLSTEKVQLKLPQVEENLFYFKHLPVKCLTINPFQVERSLSDTFSSLSNWIWTKDVGIRLLVSAVTPKSQTFPISAHNLRKYSCAFKYKMFSVGFGTWISPALSSVCEKPAYKQEEIVKMSFSGQRHCSMVSFIMIFRKGL